MSVKKKSGIVISILGIVLLAGSFYIKSQVAEGQEKIARTEAQVSIGDELLSLSPKAKELSEGVTSSVRKKIGEGQSQVDFYTDLAKYLQIGGGVFLVLGIGLFFFKKNT